MILPSTCLLGRVRPGMLLMPEGGRLPARWVRLRLRQSPSS